MRVLIAAAGLFAAACGGADEPGNAATQGDTLTRRQRDSILAESRIPGARGVGKAWNASDSVAARLRIADTIGP